MKRKVGIVKIISVICCFAAALGLAGCSAERSSSSGAGADEKRTGAAANDGNIISLSEAEDIALKHAEVKASDVRFTKTELDYENGVREYELEFISDTYKYEYEIGAADGAVLKFSRETVLTAPTERQTADPEPTEPMTEAPAPTEGQTAAPEPNEPQTEASAPTDTPVPPQTEKVTLDEAKRIALEYAGLKEADVRFTKLELDYDDGREEYEIEFYFGNKEYEFNIDAFSGKILDVEIDR
ncbi:MAG: PepSY domain-containing protein [Butyrivibrio sp.]|nr:PepSY domain-containing protein [Butyrivibrio sp.]